MCAWEESLVLAPPNGPDEHGNAMVIPGAMIILVPGGTRATRAAAGGAPLLSVSTTKKASTGLPAQRGQRQHPNKKQVTCPTRALRSAFPKASWWETSHGQGSDNSVHGPDTAEDAAPRQAPGAGSITLYYQPTDGESAAWRIRVSWLSSGHGTGHAPGQNPIPSRSDGHGITRTSTIARARVTSNISRTKSWSFGSLYAVFLPRA